MNPMNNKNFHGNRPHVFEKSGRQTDTHTHTHTHRGTGAVFKAKDSMIVASVSLPQFKLRCTQNEVDRIRAVS